MAARKKPSRAPRSAARKPRQFNIHAAKTHLSNLVARVEAGEEITIARDGKLVARLIPAQRGGGKRRLGRYAGKIWIAEDFDAPLPEAELKLWEGEGDASAP